MIEERGVREAVTAFIRERLIPAGRDFDPDSSLSGMGVLQSIDWVDLVLFIEETYQIRVGPHEMREENFDTIDGIGRYVVGKLSGE